MLVGLSNVAIKSVAKLVTPPDANTFVQDQLESQYSNEVGANTFAEQAGRLLARIASGSL